MQIYKILNNNVAVILDEFGQEKVVMGRGICYKRRPGDEIAEGVVDKTFHLMATDVNHKFQTMIQDIPFEHIAIGESIIDRAEQILEKKLNDMVYISLIDHVHTSILRFLEGITVKNVMLWDIKRFYKEEYKIGLWALEEIERVCKTKLPEDEAGFIALHLANARMNQGEMQNMYKITQIMQEIVNIVKYFFRIEFQEEDVFYYRFITHLKFFAQRLISEENYEDGSGDDLFEVIRDKYKDAYRCVEKIADFIIKKYEYELSKEEQLYLTIHIERVTQKVQNQK